MNLDLSVSNQFEKMEHSWKANLYRKIHEYSKKSKKKTTVIRLTGFGIGIVSGFLTIVKEIALIAESIFKGFINIFGCPFRPECQLTTGLMQLFGGTAKHIIYLPFCGLSAVVGLFWKTGNMAISPEKYSYKLWLSHDPAEKQAQVDRPKIAKFQQALIAIGSNANDIPNLKIVGDCYLRGCGTTKDRDQAILNYTSAANLGDVESMRILGDILSSQIADRKIAMNWYKSAAKAGDMEAISSLGLIYFEMGKHGKINAVQCFRKASQGGYPEASCYLLEMLRIYPDLSQDDKEAVNLAASCDSDMLAKAKRTLTKLS